MLRSQYSRAGTRREINRRRNSAAGPLDGSDDPDRADDGTFLLDDDFLVLVNSWWEPLEFTLPATRPHAQWHIEIDTHDPAAPDDAATFAVDAGGRITAGPRSVVVLKNPRPPDTPGGR